MSFTNNTFINRLNFMFYIDNSNLIENSLWGLKICAQTGFLIQQIRSVQSQSTIWVHHLIFHTAPLKEDWAGWEILECNLAVGGGDLSWNKTCRSDKASSLHDPTEYVPKTALCYLERGLLLLVLNVNARSMFHQQLGCFNTLFIACKMAGRKKNKNQCIAVNTEMPFPPP